MSAVIDSYDERGFATLARQENEDARWERHLELHLDDAMGDADNFAEWILEDCFTDDQDLELSMLLLKSSGPLGLEFTQYMADMCRWGQSYTFKQFSSQVDCAKKELRQLVCDAFRSSVRQSYECFCESKLSKAYDND